MRKIEIDEKTIQLAREYRDEMTRKGISAIQQFNSDITQGNIQLVSTNTYVESVKEYIDLICSSIDILYDVQPLMYKKTIEKFEDIIPEERLGEIRLKYKYGRKEVTKTFPEWIVAKMHYSDVRSKIFPKYIRQLGIKTCVYCNSQYAITTKNGLATYELDHCWPKSKYPYLSTNFFNLQPCCGTCNKNKGDENLNNDYFSLSIWKMPAENGRLFGYRIGDSSLVKYNLDHQQESIHLTYDKAGNEGKEYEESLANFERKMKVEEIYKEHCDVAEEIVWKSIIYNSSYIRSLREAFGNVFGGVEDDWFRFFYGTYMNSNEWYKRPLSELIQDIAKQIGMSE